MWLDSLKKQLLKSSGSSNITNSLIIYHLTKLLAQYPTQTAMVMEDQCCLETVCQIPMWRGKRRRRRGRRRRRISWDHRRAPRQKGHCGTDWPIQENITSCPISSGILYTWDAYFPEPRVIFLTSSAAKHLESLLTRCQHWQSKTVSYSIFVKELASAKLHFDLTLTAKTQVRQKKSRQLKQSIEGGTYSICSFKPITSLTLTADRVELR